MDTKRVIQFEDEQGDSNKLSENEKISLSLQKEKHAFNLVRYFTFFPE